MRGSALYALALNASEDAGRRLYTLAKEADGNFSEEAIFWLTQSDNDSSIAALTELLTR